MLGQMAIALKRLAAAFRIPIVASNQVTTRIGEAPSHGIGGEALPVGEAAGAAELGPALGTAWAHAVNTRLALEAGSGGRRTMRIAKSPVAPCVSFPFRITPRGVEVDPDAWDAWRVGPGASCLAAGLGNDTEYMPEP